MKRIILASANPVKLRATKAGFERFFPGESFAVESLPVPSGVRLQPFGDAETLHGSRNRALAAARLRPGADFCVGIEGGVAEVDGEMLSFSWVYIVSGVLQGKSRTAAFLLPAAVAALVRQGAELSAACDLVFQRANTSQGEGAVGLLTAGLIDRTLLYEPAVVLALVPFVNPDLFPHQTVPSAPGAD